MTLRITTLGGLVVQREREALSLLNQPVRASFLTFLAVERQTTRDRAIAMFWADRHPARARHSLSQTLYEVRRDIDEGCIDIDGETLRVGSEVWVDAHEFEAAEGAGDARRALELYGGPFLHATRLANDREFEGWVELRRARLARMHRRLRGEEIVRLLEADDAATALVLARSWVEIDPLDDEAQHRLIELLALSGLRSEALQQFETYRELVRLELEVDPLEQTVELVRRIRDSELGPSAAVPKERQRAPRTFADNTVAVLPFENLTGDDESEPFVRGIHDDLVTRLSKVPELRVIARTSVERYREAADRALPVIARELGAGWVVVGGVQRAGNRVRVNASLVDTAANRNCWAESFDRELTVENVLLIQRDITHRIAEGLQKEFSPEPKGQSKAAGTENLESYALYQRGRSELSRRSPGAIRRAVEYFQLAIEKDSENALAYTGIADVYLLGWYYGHFPSDATLHKGRDFASRAIELAPDTAKCHASRGLAEFYLRNSPGAEAAYRRALELEPANLEAHLWYGTLLMWLGKWDEGQDHVQFAAELDPLAPFPHGILTAFYFNSGDMDRAERAARRAIEVEPRYSSGRLHLASILGELGRHEEAIAQIERARADMSPEADKVFGGLAQLATAHALSGDRDTAQGLLRRAVEEGSPPPWIGWAYAALGDLEQAFQWLRRSAWQRDQIARLKLASSYTYLAPLRADPRFGIIIRELEEVWGMRDSTAPR